MANALFKLLKANNPDVHIAVLALQYLEPLFKRMSEVEKVLISSFGHGDFSLKKRYQVALNLRKENYDQAIILPNSWKSALIPFFAKIPLRTGWRGEMRYFLLNDLRVSYAFILPLMVERFVALGLAHNEILPENYPLPELSPNQESIAATLKKLSLYKTENKILALCPGAEYGPAKRWPLEYFAEVARIKAAAGWDVWIFGSKKDQAVAVEIQKMCSGVCVDLTGKTNLGEVVDLLSLVDVVITNDSGLMHIAAALNKTTIAIFGSSSPKFTPPLSKNATVLSSSLDCVPCFNRECRFGHLQCLKEIKPERVLDLI